MKKILFSLIGFFMIIGIPNNFPEANSFDTHVVQNGESMWKIAVKYQMGLSEIINANPQVNNPALIYPNQKLFIPNINEIKTVEKQVIALTNQERAKHGLPPLQEDWEVSRVARFKSKDMMEYDYFSHTSIKYGTPFHMLQQFGVKYKSAGENIAQGQRTPQEVVQAWMNSEGHRKNILSKNYTHIGVGYEDNGNIWTQMFIGK